MGKVSILGVIFPNFYTKYAKAYECQIGHNWFPVSSVIIIGHLIYTNLGLNYMEIC